MNEVSKVARIARWNRLLLSLFWGFFGVTCFLPLLRAGLWHTKTGMAVAAVGVAFLVSAWGFYRGTRWGRIAIGLLMAFLALYCFDRLLYFGFRKAFSGYFALFCALLVAAIYTWLFLFSGLDRGGPMSADRDSEEEW